MKYLYIDNFRGFSDTLIPINFVNFFVGENSTGKTSVLALLSLLASPQFWFSHDFNSCHHNFGDFNDIISANATDKKTFRIGYFVTTANNKVNGSNFRAILLTYKEREGLPDIYYFSQVKHGIILNIIMGKNSIRYHIDDFSVVKGNQNTIKDIFNRMRNFHETHTTGFKRPKLPKGLQSKAFRWPMMMSIAAQLTEDKKTDIDLEVFQIPSFFTTNIVWLAPIRTQPERTYDGFEKTFSPDGEHTPYLLRKILNKRSKKAEKFTKALKKFGKDSGLFQKVCIRRFGKDAKSPFELQVILSKEPLRINSVGYGVSQALPVVAELLSHGDDTWYAIQQPEVHLHPRAQAALGDLIFNLAKSESKHFLIETHSDFTIDRYRNNYSTKQKANIEAQVLFFERINGGNKVTPIPIMPNGDYSSDQPRSYRDFFLKEQMSILGI